MPPAPQQHGTFTLLLFGPAQTFCADTSTLQLPAPTTLAAVLTELERRFPGFGARVLRSSQVALNLEYVEWGEETAGEVAIGVGDELGIVPPVSAG